MLFILFQYYSNFVLSLKFYRTAFFHHINHSKLLFALEKKVELSEKKSGHNQENV